MNIFKKIISIFVMTSFLATSAVPSPAQAQSLPLSIGGIYHPPVLQGIRVDLKDPFHLEFVIDPGETADSDKLQTQSSSLIKYFLAALTVPGNDLWVNLSPAEPDRIIPQAFGQTNMGHDLLAEDYLLKQLTSSLLSPENEAGKRFWDEVYKQTYEKFGASNIPTETLNKVWVVPDIADVYQNGGAAYITNSRLKVMLEEDYAARDIVGVAPRGYPGEHRGSPLQDDVQSIIRQIIIPILEKDVNEGENFVQLRQIYHAVILAKWFKENLKKSLLGSEYVDKNKVGGIDEAGKDSTKNIYQKYLEAFRKGAYDVIKEDYDPSTQQVIPRKYFTGGFHLDPQVNYLSSMPDSASHVANAMLADVTLGGSLGENSGQISSFLFPNRRDIFSDLTLIERGPDGDWLSYQAKDVEKGEPWIFRAFPKKAYAALAEIIYFELSRRIGLQSVPDIRAGQINNEPGIFIREEWASNSQTLKDVFGNGVDAVKDLTQEEIMILARQYILDWLLMRSDASSADFIRTLNGKFFISAASGALEDFRQSSITPTGKQSPYAILFRKLANGELRDVVDFDQVRKTVLEIVSAIEEINDEEFIGIFEDYMDLRFGNEDAERAEFEAALRKRKSSLRSDVERFYGDMEKKIVQAAPIIRPDFTEGMSYVLDLFHHGVDSRDISLVEILAPAERHPELIGEILIDVDSLIQPESYVGSLREAIDLIHAGVDPDDAWKKIKAVRHDIPGSMIGAVDSEGLNLLKDFVIRHPQCRVMLTVVGGRYDADDLRRWMAELGLEVPLRIFKSSKQKFEFVSSAEPLAKGQTRILVESRRVELAARKTLVHLTQDRTYVFQSRDRDHPDTTALLESWRSSPQEDERKFWLAMDVLASSIFDNSISGRFEIYSELWPLVQASNHPRLISVFVEAVSDWLSRIPSSNGIKDVDGLTAGQINGLVHHYFHLIAPHNPDSLADAVMDGSLRLRKALDANRKNAWRGYYEIVEDEKSIYVLLEPLLKKIVAQQPDVIILPDIGARRFTKIIEWFVQEMKAKGVITSECRVINFPVSYRDAKDTEYELGRWASFMGAPALTPEDRSIQNKMQAIFMTDLIRARSVVFLDEGLMEGNTSGMMLRFLQRFGFIRDFSVVVPYALAPEEDFKSPVTATVRMVLPQRGFIGKGEFPSVVLPWDFTPERRGYSRREYSSPASRNEMPQEALAYQEALLEGFKRSFMDQEAAFLASQSPAQNHEDAHASPLPSAGERERTFANPNGFTERVPSMISRPNGDMSYAVKMSPIPDTGTQYLWATDSVYFSPDEMDMLSEDNRFYVFGVSLENIGRPSGSGHTHTANIAAVVVSVHPDSAYPSDSGKKILVIRKIQPRMEYDHLFQENDGKLTIDIVDTITQHIKAYATDFTKVYLPGVSGYRSISESHAVRRAVRAFSETSVKNYVPSSRARRVPYLPREFMVDPVTGRLAPMDVVWQDISEDQLAEWHNLQKKIRDIEGYFESMLDEVSGTLWNNQELRAFSAAAMKIKRGLLVDRAESRQIRWFYEVMKRMTPSAKSKTEIEENLNLSDRNDVERLKVRMLSVILVEDRKQDMLRARPGERLSEDYKEEFFAWQKDAAESGENISYPVDFFNGDYSELRSLEAVKYFLKHVVPENTSFTKFSIHVYYRFGVGPAAEKFHYREDRTKLFGKLLPGAFGRRSSNRSEVIAAEFDMDGNWMMRFLKGETYGVISAKSRSYEINELFLSRLQKTPTFSYLAQAKYLVPGTRIDFFHPQNKPKQDWAVAEGQGVFYVDEKDQTLFAPYRPAVRMIWQHMQGRDVTVRPSEEISYVVTADPNDIEGIGNVGDMINYGFYDARNLKMTEEFDPVADNYQDDDGYAAVKVRLRPAGADNKLVYDFMLFDGKQWNIRRTVDAKFQDVGSAGQESAAAITNFAMLHLDKLNDAEHEPMVQKIKESLNRKHKQMYEKFYGIIQGIQPDTHLDADMTDKFFDEGTLKGLVFVKDGNSGDIWVLKKLDPGWIGQGSHARFSSSMTKALMPDHFEEVRLLTADDQIQGMDGVQGHESEYYLSRFIVDDEQDLSEPDEGIIEQYITDVITALWLRKSDFHWTNLVFDGQYPVMIDSDKILTNTGFDRNRIEQFYRKFIDKALGAVSPSPQSEDIYTRDLVESSEQDRSFGFAFQAALKVKDEPVPLEDISRLARLSGFGPAFSQVFHLTFANRPIILKVIKKIQSLERNFIKEKLQDAGFQKFGTSEAGKDMLTYALANQRSLIGDVNEFLKILTGEDYHLDQLDEGENMAMLNPFENKKEEIDQILGGLPELRRETQDQLLKLFRLFSLIAGDMDHTFTDYNSEGTTIASKNPMNIALVSLLHGYLSSKPKERFMAVLTGALEDQPLSLVKNQFPQETRELINKIFYIAAANGNRVFVPGEVKEENSIYIEDLRAILGEGSWNILQGIIKDSLREAESLHSAFGHFEMQDKTSSIAVFYQTDRTLRKKSALKALASALKRRIQESNDPNLLLLKVLVSSVAVNISTKDKGDAMEALAGHIAQQLSQSAENILQDTMAFGDSELDLPMLIRTIKSGGVAVWVGYAEDDSLKEAWESLSEAERERFVIVNQAGDSQFYGPTGTTAVMKFFTDWVKGQDGVQPVSGSDNAMMVIDPDLQNMRSYFNELRGQIAEGVEKYVHGWGFLGPQNLDAWIEQDEWNIMRRQLGRDYWIQEGYKPILSRNYQCFKKISEFSGESQKFLNDMQGWSWDDYMKVYTSGYYPQDSQKPSILRPIDFLLIKLGYWFDNQDFIDRVRNTEYFIMPRVREMSQELKGVKPVESAAFMKSYAQWHPRVLMFGSPDLLGYPQEIRFSQETSDINTLRYLLFALTSSYQLNSYNVIFCDVWQHFRNNIFPHLPLGLRGRIVNTGYFGGMTYGDIKTGQPQNVMYLKDFLGEQQYSQAVELIRKIVVRYLPDHQLPDSMSIPYYFNFQDAHMAKRFSEELGSLFRTNPLFSDLLYVKIKRETSVEILVNNPTRMIPVVYQKVEKQFSDFTGNIGRETVMLAGKGHPVELKMMKAVLEAGGGVGWFGDAADSRIKELLSYERFVVIGGGIEGVKSVMKMLVELNQHNDRAMMNNGHDPRLLWDSLSNQHMIDEAHPRVFDIKFQEYGYIDHDNQGSYFWRIDPATGEKKMRDDKVLSPVRLTADKMSVLKYISKDILLDYEIQNADLRRDLEKMRRIWGDIGEDLKKAQNIWGNEVFKGIPVLQQFGTSFFHWKNYAYLERREIDLMLQNSGFANAVAQVKTIGQADASTRKDLLYWSGALSEVEQKDIRKVFLVHDAPLIAPEKILLQYGYWIDANSFWDRLSDFERIHQEISSSEILPSDVVKALDDPVHSLVIGSKRFLLSLGDGAGFQGTLDSDSADSLNQWLDSPGNWMTVVSQETMREFERQIVSALSTNALKKVIDISRSGAYFPYEQDEELIFGNVIDIRDILGEKAMPILRAIEDEARPFSPDVDLTSHRYLYLSQLIRVSDRGNIPKLEEKLQFLLEENKWTFLSLETSYRGIHVYYNDQVNVVEKVLEKKKDRFQRPDFDRETLVVGYGLEDLPLLIMARLRGSRVLWVGDEGDLSKVHEYLPDVLYVNEKEGPIRIMQAVLRILAGQSHQQAHLRGRQRENNTAAINTRVDEAMMVELETEQNEIREQFERIRKALAEGVKTHIQGWSFLGPQNLGAWIDENEWSQVERQIRKPGWSPRAEQILRKNIKLFKGIHQDPPADPGLHLLLEEMSEWSWEYYTNIYTIANPVKANQRELIFLRPIDFLLIKMGYWFDSPDFRSRIKNTHYYVMPRVHQLSEKIAEVAVDQQVLGQLYLIWQPRVIMFGSSDLIGYPEGELVSNKEISDFHIIRHFLFSLMGSYPERQAYAVIFNKSWKYFEGSIRPRFSWGIRDRILNTSYIGGATVEKLYQGVKNNMFMRDVLGTEYERMVQMIQEMMSRYYTNYKVPYLNVPAYFNFVNPDFTKEFVDGLSRKIADDPLFSRLFDVVQTSSLRATIMLKDQSVLLNIIRDKIQDKWFKTKDDLSKETVMFASRTEPEELEMVRAVLEAGGGVGWFGNPDASEIQKFKDYNKFLAIGGGVKGVKSIMKALVQLHPRKDAAMMSITTSELDEQSDSQASNIDANTGGVDFRMDSFGVNVQGENALFDQAALQKIKIDGLKPISITLSPLKSLDEFLGIASAVPVFAQAN